MEMVMRALEKRDNAELARIIRETLTEYNANKPGTVYFDPTTDDLFTVFGKEGSCYFVVETNDELLGGCGIYPTEDLPPGMCELVKLYLKPTAHGKGIGKQLMEKCIAKAKDMGYTSIYLETMPELTQAIPLYKKLGFQFIPTALGNSGHHGCDLFMLKYIGESGTGYEEVMKASFTW